jgi:hypothetical protein
MPRPHRRSAPKVVNGRVQKKNNWVINRNDYFARSQSEIRIDRRDPGTGHRHLLTVSDVRRFLPLLPDWDELAVGLRAIVLDDDTAEAAGWYAPGVVAICSWERQLWWSDANPDFVAEHEPELQRLGVEVEEKTGVLEVRWTEAQARAFQLLHVLPHEMGHHHDLITTASKMPNARGEPYAETYARRVMDQVFDTYCRAFDL